MISKRRQQGFQVATQTAKTRELSQRLVATKKFMSRQPNEGAVKNSGVTEETRSRLYIVKKTKKVATSK